MENYILIKSQNTDEVRKQIEKNYKQGIKIAVLGGNDEFNRKILENKKVSLLVSPESGIKNDKLKQLDSGLNQVLCKIANENNISIGIDIKGLLSQKEEERIKRIARLLQNIDLCKKYKVKVIIINSDIDKHDVFALLLSWGMPTAMAKYAVDNAVKIE
ncbi:MAG: RNase P subunit p30 family protein [Candidatus Pacearchaeota archaeon]|jgi:RNase P/RNase MRP subunit p30